jgi:peptidoglycan hydrolase CwlO-like protein
MTVIYEFRILRLEMDDVINILHAFTRDNYQLEQHIQQLVDGIEIVEGRIESLFEEFMDLVSEITETESEISN